MAKLFEATRIKDLTLPNRFVRSATLEGMASPDGLVTPQLIETMVKLARGGVGLIITGLAFPAEEARVLPRWQLGVHSDNLLSGLSEMTRAVQEAGGKIALQIGYGGAQTNPKVIGQIPMGPSVLDGEGGFTCREMNLEEIRHVTRSMGEAAERARTAGFDAVQLLGAHGYLLSEFLSPFFNRRTDAYGGSIEKRARMVLETYGEVRKAVGDDYPVMMKINATDSMAGGLGVEEMLRFASFLEKAGIDALEVSGGTTMALLRGDVEASWARTGDTEAYWQEAAARLKNAVHVPVMLVGGVRSYAVAEKFVAQGVADYVSLCRPLIREPDLVNKWKSGGTRGAECIRCNGCLGPLGQGKGTRCVHVQ